MKAIPYITLLAVATLVLAGCEQDSSHDEDHDRTEARDEDREVLYWYDPMHPETRFDQPGPSPFMDMDLVPRYADEVTPGEVEVAPGIQQVMNIRTAAVERGTLVRRIETVGRVDYDQSRLHQIHPRVDGWIEEVGVHAIGEPVRSGSLLFAMYSPELVNAQEEFLSALRRDNERDLASAREKLGSLAVQSEAIEALERDREVRHALPWIARRDGFVTDLGIRHGMHVGPGDMLLEMVDLSEVWVMADVFDRHAEWLASGQPAHLRSSYDPGTTLHSEIGYIYPQLDTTTRTVRVRIPVENANAALKPGMWVSVAIDAAAAEDRVHIPREALIRTGRAERVVLRDDTTRFLVREVVAGMESGERIEILEGVEAGEQVVVSGHFLLDSEAALGAGFDRLEGVDAEAGAGGASGDADQRHQH